MIINETCSLIELRMEAALCKRQITIDAAYHLRRILARRHYGQDMADVPLRSFVAAVDEAVQCGPEHECRPQPWTELAASLYQACGAYDMPERILDVLSLAQRGEPFGHLIDGLLPCAPQPESEPVYVVVAGGIGPGEEFVEIENAQGKSVGVPHSMDGDYRRIGPLYASPQPTPQVPDWPGIDSAPKDRPILGCQSRHGIIRVVRGPADEFGNWSTGPSSMDFLAEVTHWKELPTPPSSPSIAEKREWIQGPPVYEGDGGILHIPLQGCPNYLAVGFVTENGGLEDQLGDPIGYEADAVEKWIEFPDIPLAGVRRPEPPDGGEQ